MSERRVYAARPKGQPKRRFEWVPLPEGDICMWSLSMSEASNITEQARRPALGDLPARIDPTMSGALEVLISAHDDEPDAPKPQRIFTDIQQVYDLPFAEYADLVKAGMRANGKDEETLGELAAFTEARQATNSAS
jgi:hypothetical protein